MRYFEVKALLFDMDGTLVDSRAQVERTWSAWCARHGLDLDAIREHTHGVRTEDTLRHVAAGLLYGLDVAAELAWVEALDLDTAGVAAVEGAARMLASLPVQSWAVVSSAPRALLEARFAHCALPLPEVVVSAETVKRGKPSPDPYQQAAQRLGVDPADCIVFEDAPAGLESALAAGCRVVLVGGLRSNRAGVIACIADYLPIEVRVGDCLRLAIVSEGCQMPALAVAL